jgi:hypothetical protein
MAKRKKANRAKGRVQKSRSKWLIPLICLILVLLVVAALNHFKARPLKEETAAISTERETPDFDKLLGSWVRPDGGYVIRVRKIHPDGKVDAAYSNPRPIHISRSRAAEIDGMIELLIELQDQGYPGSTYELRYDPEYDVLAGVYFQAVIQQRFDVVFQRK